MAKPVFGTGDVPTATQVNSWFVNVTYVRKTSTESRFSTTTLSTDSELFVSVEANAAYEVTAVLLTGGSGAGVAGDIKVLFRTPTSGTFVGQGLTLVSAASSQTEVQSLPYAGNASEAWGTLGAGTAYGTVRGLLITAGSSGNFSVEWAQNTANATATTVQGNSFLSLRRLS